MSDAAGTITLSLIAHTNVGKTTLARTLLGRDIGEVRDAPHVTEFAEVHPLLTTDAGDVLQLADTPGFGDSVRLARRLGQADSPLGWFLAEVWDRFTDRAFWASQQALRHVRDTTDVVLYLVNAAEAPEAAGYVDAEMELLGWIGKPVVVLLNQLGAPRDAAHEAAEVERWRRHLAAQPLVTRVLPLDAFARCWVQEGVLLAAVEAALPPPQRPAMARLRAAWQARREATFDAG
uniref:GTPase domain-containing protein n=1 Tax=Azohydromonas sediminis TaxID=2259674 RepID=UPI0013C2E308